MVSLPKPYQNPSSTSNHCRTVFTFIIYISSFLLLIDSAERQCTFTKICIRKELNRNLLWKQRLSQEKFLQCPKSQLYSAELLCAPQQTWDDSCSQAAMCQAPVSALRCSFLVLWGPFVPQLLQLHKESHQAHEEQLLKVTNSDCQRTKHVMK